MKNHPLADTKTQKHLASVIFLVVLGFSLSSTASAKGKFRQWFRERSREITQRKIQTRSASLKSTYEKIKIVNEPYRFGAYDPSIEYDENGVGWMVYSAMPGEKNNPHLETHLAKSLDHGKIWEFVKPINFTQNAAFNYKGSVTRGIWRNETASLVYDPQEPDENKRWKLFWVYMFTPGKYIDSYWEYVTIGYKHASTPAELSDAETIVLFSSHDLPFPYRQRVNINSMDPALKDVFFYMEPGSFEKNGVLYVSLSAVLQPDGGGQRQKIILMASFDHGKTWQYTETLINNDEIIDLKRPVLTASSIAEENNRVFLFASPKKVRIGGYNGIYIFEFDDITQGRLQRNHDGKLIVYKHIPPIGNKLWGGGQSTYHEENTNGGIIMSQTKQGVMPGTEDFFQIYSTNWKIIKSIGKPLVAKKLLYEKINIHGEQDVWGIYDPSVEYDDNGAGWMVYSSMNHQRRGYLETSLAKSLDHGKIWKFVNVINKVQEDNLIINNKVIEKQVGAKSVHGVWRHETPTLVYDADDPNFNRRWKLFWIKAFSRQPYTNAQLDNNVFYGHSLIMYKYAATPEWLAGAKEIPLFNSQLFAPSADYNLNELNPSLDNFFFYMEPGAIAYEGALYLIIQGSPLPPMKPVLLLFSSKNHGQNWEFVKTLINSEDAEFFDYESFTAPSIVKKEGRLFLLVSPVKKKNIPLPHLQYSGIYILRFENIVKGKLERDNNGNLVIQKYIPPLSTISVGGGQSDYDEQNIYGGIIMAQSAPKEPKKKFQIYNTKQQIAY